MTRRPRIGSILTLLPARARRPHSQSGIRRAVRELLPRSILPLLRLELRDGHRLELELNPFRRLIRQGVFQPTRVVAFREVFAGVRAAALLAGQRARDDGFPDLDHPPELEYLEQLGVIFPAAVFDLHL